MIYGYYYRTPGILQYNRDKAVAYAHKWAYARNPAYTDFEKMGGDCTNFASQVIYAGSGVMNHTRDYGWYYYDLNRRTPSWTGVNFLYNFLVGNKGPGPFAEVVDVRDVKAGDIVQLSFDGGGSFDHSPVIVGTGRVPDVDNILISTHTDDQDNYLLTNYGWREIRFIHIIGVRKSEA